MSVPSSKNSAEALIMPSGSVTVHLGQRLTYNICCPSMSITSKPNSWVTLSQNCGLDYRSFCMLNHTRALCICVIPQRSVCRASALLQQHHKGPWSSCSCSPSLAILQNCLQAHWELCNWHWSQGPYHYRTWGGVLSHNRGHLTHAFSDELTTPTTPFLSSPPVHHLFQAEDTILHP